MVVNFLCMRLPFTRPYESNHCFHTPNMHPASKPSTSSLPPFYPRGVGHHVVTAKLCDGNGRGFSTVTSGMGVVTLPWSSRASNYTFVVNDTLEADAVYRLPASTLYSNDTFMW